MPFPFARPLSFSFGALALAMLSQAPVLASMRELRGDGPVGALQAPVSFRVTPPALAVATRALDALDAAADLIRAIPESERQALSEHYVQLREALESQQ